MKGFMLKLLSSQSINMLFGGVIMLLSFFLPNSYFTYYLFPTRIVFIYVPLVLLLFHFATSELRNIAYLFRLGLKAYHQLSICYAFILSALITVVIFVAHCFVAIHLLSAFEGYYMHVLLFVYIFTIQMLYLSVKILSDQSVLALIIVVLIAISDYIFPVITAFDSNFVNEISILRSVSSSTIMLGLPFIILLLMQIPLQGFYRERDYLE